MPQMVVADRVIQAIRHLSQEESAAVAEAFQAIEKNPYQPPLTARVQSRPGLYMVEVSPDLLVVYRIRPSATQAVSSLNDWVVEIEDIVSERLLKRFSLAG